MKRELDHSIAIDGRNIRPEHAGVRVYLTNLLHACLKNYGPPSVVWEFHLEVKFWHALPLEVVKQIDDSETVRVVVYKKTNKLRTLLTPLLTNENRIFTLSPDYYGSLVERGNRAVVVHDLHFLTHPDTFSYSQKVFRKSMFLVNRLLKPKVLTISENTKHEVLSYMPALKERLVFIGSGSTISMITPQPCKDLNSSKFILCVGTLNRHKNHVRLIEAFVRLDEKILKSTTLILVGKRGNSAKLVQQAAISAVQQGAQVQILHGLTDAKIAWLYSKSMGVVLPTKYEGYGLPLAEAIDMRCPVACSDLPILREVGGDVPHYFNPDSVSEISEALRMLCISEIKKPTLQARRSCSFGDVPSRIADMALRAESLTRHNF